MTNLRQLISSVICDVCCTKRSSVCLEHCQINKGDIENSKYLYLQQFELDFLIPKDE